jgi:Fe-S oxidoreductase
MATYKAEFLSHYYENTTRPLSAYSMGLIYWWARLGSILPPIANFFTQTPGLREVAKLFGGIATRRSIPKFAPRTFKSWFRSRGPRNAGRQGVILWPDTFNNHFHPEVPMAAVEVLEEYGFRVLVPKASLCCGRPLYDFGMLDTAKGLLRNVVDTLAPAIRRGTPIVGLEPSCVAVFRDELLDLFPDDEDALRLSRQTFTLAEFLDRHQGEFALPKLNRKAVVHGHCHHKAIMKMDADRRVLDRLDLDYRVLDSGCCGMAGSFGFENEHYEISQQVGEHELFPHLREASGDTLILTDGFSCREQIEQSLGRHPVHLAQVLAMAIRERRGDRVLAAPMSIDPRLLVATGAAGLMIGGGLLWGLQKGRVRKRSGE